MLEFIIIVIIIFIDQISKYLTTSYLKPIGSITILKNVFNLTYVENRGAAFGMLQNQRWLFIVLTIIIAIAVACYLILNRNESLILRISLSMILGGAIGNLIDRIRLGYVVDMLYFSLIDFPVFNVADSFIVIGTILLGYYILFMAEKEGKMIG